MTRIDRLFAAPAGALALCLVLAAGAALARLAPHAPNMTPVAACALFAAFATGRARWGAGTALAALAVSDLAIGGYDPLVAASVYACLAAPAFLGARIDRGAPAARIGLFAGGGALASSALFFIVTNAAEWASGRIYPMTAEGLAACYQAALPFLRFTLAGDLLWTGALFGSYLAATRLRAALSPET